MPRRYINLVLFLCALSATWLVSCEQAEDILTPVGTSRIHLDAARLPTTPDGMVYELWATRWTTTERSEADTVSLGKFQYDFEDETFLNPEGKVRADSNVFVLEDDILAMFTDDQGESFFKYTSLFLSVETGMDPDPTRPANTMLRDTVSVTSDDPVELEVPLLDDLWAATVRFSMETTSDGRSAESDGRGIWFANYGLDSTTIQDTTGYAFTIDTVMKTIPQDTVVESVVDIDTVGEDLGRQTIKKVFGLDTVEQEMFVRNVIREKDSTGPEYLTTTVTEDWEVDEESIDSIFFDKFSQDKFNFPVYDAYGFHYKGWVVSPHISPTAGRFTRPAWLLFGGELFDVFPGAENGGIITIGTFSRVEQPDDANPYVASPKVPPFPGEDFFVNLPPGVPQPLNLVQPGAETNGTVFVTLEPMNFTGRKTNFPLIAFARELPATRAEIEAPQHHFTMRGWMWTNDPFRGFPTLTATFERF